jgi:predicted O-methyltransferase YrrM
VIGDHVEVESTLSSDRVQTVLAQLRETGELEDGRAKRRVRAREAELGTKLYGHERAVLGVSASLAIAPAVGRLLYALTLAARPAVIVEFGTSLGSSTIYLASALRDLGAGSIITTELLDQKAQRASSNLALAGLGGLVEIRVGAALDSLANLDADVDLVFLDGSNDLYLPVLELVEPRLSPGALVIADMSHDDPHHERYRDHVNDPARGYLTTEIPLDAGLVISTRTPTGAT